MSLFNKIEVDPNVIPFVKKGEGVGIVKVDGYGKATARMESYKIILDSYDDKQPIIESISAINYLSYDKGNFFKEPKLEIGIAHKKYILAGVENNDEELESFYNSLLDMKNREKQQRMATRGSFSRNNISLNNNSEFEENQKIQNKVKEVDSDSVDEIIDLEKEVILEDNKIEESSQNNNDEDELLDDLIEENSDDFVVLEEVVTDSDFAADEDVISKDTGSETNELVDEITIEEKLVEEESVDDIVVEEEFVEETIEENVEDTNFEDNESDTEEKSDEEALTDEEIIEDLNEVNDIIDEDIDLDRIVNESEIESSDDVVDEKIEKLEEEPEVVEVKTEEKAVSPTDIVDNEITNENMDLEINKMKQNIFNDINSIQNEINPNNQNTANYISTRHQVDPVEQIRRYHQLKEDGIITEEEFELKKKQLLDLE